MKLVLVRWLDAWSDLDGSPDSWRAEYNVETVGWLVRDTASVVSVAQELLPDGDGFRAITHIPRPIVLAVLPLEIP